MPEHLPVSQRHFLMRSAMGHKLYLAHVRSLTSNSLFLLLKHHVSSLFLHFMYFVLLLWCVRGQLEVYPLCAL